MIYFQYLTKSINQRLNKNRRKNKKLLKII